MKETQRTLNKSQEGADCRSLAGIVERDFCNEHILISVDKGRFFVRSFVNRRVDSVFRVADGLGEVSEFISVIVKEFNLLREGARSAPVEEASRHAISSDRTQTPQCGFQSREVNP